MFKPFDYETNPATGNTKGFEEPTTTDKIIDGAKKATMIGGTVALGLGLLAGCGAEAETQATAPAQSFVTNYPGLAVPVGQAFTQQPIAPATEAPVQPATEAPVEVAKNGLPSLCSSGDSLWDERNLIVQRLGHEWSMDDCCGHVESPGIGFDGIAKQSFQYIVCQQRFADELRPLGIWHGQRFQENGWPTGFEEHGPGPGPQYSDELLSLFDNGYRVLEHR